MLSLLLCLVTVAGAGLMAVQAEDDPEMPIFPFIEFEDRTYYTTDTVVFDVQYFGGNCDGIKYALNFGDNVITSWQESNLFEHSFNAPGDYYVTAMVKDCHDEIVESTGVLVNIGNHAPMPVVRFTPLEPYTGDRVDFDASKSRDRDGTIDRFEWRFSGFFKEGTSRASHVFDRPGEQNIKLRVTDNFGSYEEIQLTIVVRSHKPTVELVALQDTGFVGTIFEFTVKGSDEDGDKLTFHWDLGNGQETQGTQVTCAYGEIGIYRVSVYAKDQWDERSEVVKKTIFILNREPEAKYKASDKTVDQHKLIEFDATGSSDPEGGELNYRWDFGDNTDGEGAFITHSYAEPGDYIITLTVTDVEGANNTYFNWITVESVESETVTENTATTTDGGVDIWLYLPLGLIIFIASVLVLRNRGRGNLPEEDDEDDGWDFDLEEEEMNEPDEEDGNEWLTGYRRSTGGAGSEPFSIAAMQTRARMERDRIDAGAGPRTIVERIEEPEPQVVYRPNVPNVNWHRLYHYSEDINPEVPRRVSKPEKTYEKPDFYSIFMDNLSRKIGDERVDKEFADRERFRSFGEQVISRNPYSNAIEKMRTSYY
jgi:PKD repeat protein